MTAEAPPERVRTPRDAKQLTASSTACLFNLIIYAHHPDKIASLQVLTEAVTERFPCRIIFIQSDASSEPVLDIKASLCSTVDGRLPDYEEIRIAVSSPNLNRIPYVILSYLLSDLPVFLLWGQDPSTEKEVLPSLLHLANRLIVDSESTDNLHRFSQQALALREHEELDIIDLNWARISGWREAIRKVFDSSDRLQSLAKATQITIRYNQVAGLPEAGTQTQALYLQAWLASRFGWILQKITKEGSNKVGIYQNGTNEVRVCLIADSERDRPPGMLLGVEVSAPNQSDFLMKRLANSRQLLVHISSSEACELPFTLLLPGVRRSYPFLKELFYAPGSPQYFTMLHLLAQQDWNL